jgi:hypothetical protein
MGNTLEVIQGTGQSFPKQLRGTDGRPYTGCLPGDTFDVVLYPGDELAPITPTPVATWISEVLGTFAIGVPASVSAIEPGDYSLLVKLVLTASGGGATQAAFRGILRILDAAGTGIVGSVYNTEDDMEEYYPNITRMVKSSDQTGYARARHSAWAEINRIILEKVDLIPGKAMRRYADAVIGVGFDRADITTVPPSVDLLRKSLIAGGLVLDEVDKPIMARIAAGMTLDIVLNSKEGGDRARNPMAESAREAGSDAASELRRFEPYIDLLQPDANGTLDGDADLLIRADRRPVYLNGWGLP